MENPCKKKGGGTAVVDDDVLTLNAVLLRWPL